MFLPIPRGYAKQVVREIIDARFDAVKQNPELVEVDRWGVSNVYYDTRKRLDAEGYDVSPLNDESTKIRKDSIAMLKNTVIRLFTVFIVIGLGQGKQPRV